MKTRRGRLCSDVYPNQFVEPHNLYLTVCPPTSVDVMPFDPLHGAHHARIYATTYCKRLFLFVSCIGSVCQQIALIMRGLRIAFTIKH